MSEHSHDTMSEEDRKVYKEQYPDAVDDIEKAHFAASKSNFDRSIAARHRNIGKELIEEYRDDPRTVRYHIDDKYKKALREVDESQGKSKSARERLHVLRIAKEFLDDRTGSATEVAIKSVTHVVKSRDRQAEIYENGALARYDEAEGMLKDLGVKNKINNN